MPLTKWVQFNPIEWKRVRDREWWDQRVQGENSNWKRSVGKLRVQTTAVEVEGFLNNADVKWAVTLFFSLSLFFFFIFTCWMWTHPFHNNNYIRVKDMMHFTLATVNNIYTHLHQMMSCDRYMDFMLIHVAILMTAIVCALSAWKLVTIIFTFSYGNWLALYLSHSFALNSLSTIDADCDE